MSGKLRVLEVCNLDRFAASPYMLPLFRGLAESGHEVHVACRLTSFARTLEEAGLTVHDLPITRNVTPISDLKAYFRLKSLIREGGFDIVHTHNPKDGILGRLAAWRLGVRAVVHTCNGFYFSHRSSSLRRRLVLAAERFAGKRCHLVIFVNTDDLLVAAAEKIVSPARARLIHNGVDLERFKPGEDDGLREELGIPTGAAVVGYVGEIRREKNLDTLVEAAGRLMPEHPDLYLVMVGDSSMEPREPERLLRLASRLSAPTAGAATKGGGNGRPGTGGDAPQVATRLDEGTRPGGGAEPGGGSAARGTGPEDLAARVLFTGYRSDPERFYRVFDVYVLPSTREGFGVSLIEAMATGIPVIACDVRGPREIVEDGRDGILVKDRDPAALADAVSFYLQAPAAVENYTRRARRKVEREFDHARMRARLSEEYRRLTS